jgi:hypothetical protein
MKNIKYLLPIICLVGASKLASAQELHVNPRWSECSFQLDPSLTQKSWNQFAREAALVAYFRPLTDARPLGAKHFEIAILKWSTAIDDTKDAWNDTFVHPDSAHWLVEGPRLPIPGITARVGITDRLDAAIYWTKSPKANYGFWGGQLQYNFVDNKTTNWSASGRVSFISLHGPADLKFNIYGAEGIVSREFPIFSKWASVAPYVGLGTLVSSAHETTEKVALKNETVVGAQAMAGAVLKASVARIAVEYNVARVNTISLKLGVAF